MKLEFDDKSYIEIIKSNEKICVSIGAKSMENSKKVILNSVELSMEDLKLLLSDIFKKE